MSIFLSDEVKTLINSHDADDRQFWDLYWMLYNRAKSCASRPGIIELGDTNDWWYSVFDYVSNAAMMYALKPDAQLAAYIHDATLSIVRRNEQDWIGPWFRYYDKELPQAALETAHLSWAVSSAYDLAYDVFTEVEISEIEECLANRAIKFCRNFFDNRTTANNWNCIINAGLAVAASVINDKENIKYSADKYLDLCGLYQDDGSYCESLQYSNYAQMGLMLSYESLTGVAPSLIENFSPESYGKGMKWLVASYFYHAPQENWDAQSRPRFANFNDSAAIFRPTGDILLHIANRCKNTLVEEAGLARWMFNRCYDGNSERKPLDLASFGFNGITGFLTLPLLLNASHETSPESAGIAEINSFDCGDTCLRDEWDGDTVIAIHGGAENQAVNAHCHDDRGSFIIAHRKERLLVDPGHSCYRGLLHDVEVKTNNHNACIYISNKNNKYLEIQQTNRLSYRSVLENGLLGEKIPGFSKRLLSSAINGWRVTGYDNSRAYASPITESVRMWFYHCDGAMFVVDKMRSSEVVTPVWNWVLNNHGGCLEYKPLPPDRFVMRRNNSAMKMFHCGGGMLTGPRYGFVHDSYHPLPGQQGEGKPGSAWIVQWRTREAVQEDICIHAIALDSYGAVAGWHLVDHCKNSAVLESPKKIKYSFEYNGNAFILKDGKCEYSVHNIDDGRWDFIQQ